MEDNQVFGAAASETPTRGEGANTPLLEKPIVTKSSRSQQLQQQQQQQQQQQLQSHSSSSSSQQQHQHLLNSHSSSQQQQQHLLPSHSQSQSSQQKYPSTFQQDQQTPVPEGFQHTGLQQQQQKHDQYDQHEHHDQLQIVDQGDRGNQYQGDRERDQHQQGQQRQGDQFQGRQGDQYQQGQQRQGDQHHQQGQQRQGDQYQQGQQRQGDQYQQGQQRQGDFSQQSRSQQTTGVSANLNRDQPQQQQYQQQSQQPQQQQYRQQQQPQQYQQSQSQHQQPHQQRSGHHRDTITNTKSGNLNNNNNNNNNNSSTNTSSANAGANTTTLTIYRGGDVTAPKTFSDVLYITTTYLVSFAAALSFPGVWNAGLHHDHVTNTYVAFAFLFLLSVFPEAIMLIEGLTRIPAERVLILQRSALLSVWNLLCLIIAIATDIPGYNDLGFVAGLGVAPACLIAALVLMAACFGIQIVAHMLAVKNKNKPEVLAAYLPVVFLKSIVRELIIANAILATVVLALAVGSLMYLSPINVTEFSDTYYAGAAFTVIFFFVALIGQIISIVGLFPSAVPNRMSVLISWIFHALSFVTALLTWFLQLFSRVAIVKDQQAMILLGWIIALATTCLGVATFVILDERVGCCNEQDSTVRNTKEMADIERHRFEALQFRKQREAIERHDGTYSAAPQTGHIPVPSHQVI